MKVGASRLAFLVLASFYVSISIHASAALAAPGAHSSRAAAKRRPPKVAVQPIEGSSGPQVRNLVVQIVRNHGYRTLTSLPGYEGTGQYPGLARDHNLAAFVTADLAEKGNRRSITFLVWSGLSGSVLGRWSVNASSAILGRAVGRGFWRNLGPILAKAEAPPSNKFDEAAPMKIDATDDTDEPVASRE